MDRTPVRIVCFHLFNDYSGSPKVLRGIVEGLLKKGYEIELVTSSGGTLDSISSPNLTRRSYSYKFSPNGLVTLLRYSWTQLATFLGAFRYAFQRDMIFYINTILPVGPALAGRLMGKRVVYHYHENAMVKSAFYRFLAGVMQKIADKIICVSEYQASFLRRKNEVSVVPNVLDEEFIRKLQPDIETAFERKNILMLSSLKEYKGTKEFLQLATALPQFTFTLVINDTQEGIDEWLERERICPADNVKIYPRTDDVTPFYNSSSLVLNLSNPRLFIETFGLTALEAMSCALPVIVPPVGGITEMVEDGYNGYKIDCSETAKLTETIKNVLEDKALYMRLAANAQTISQRFDRDNAIKTIISVLND